MNKEDLIGCAEDLVQETVLSALLAIEQGRAIASPKAWLQRVLNRKYYDFLRQKYRRPTVSIDLLYDSQYQEQDAAAGLAIPVT